MNANEQNFPVVLFIVPYKMVLTFVSVDEILKCDLSNESCCAVREDRLILNFYNRRNCPSSMHTYQEQLG